MRPVCACCGHKYDYMYMTLAGVVYCFACSKRQCALCYNKPQPPTARIGELRP